MEIKFNLCLEKTETLSEPSFQVFRNFLFQTRNLFNHASINLYMIFRPENIHANRK